MASTRRQTTQQLLVRAGRIPHSASSFPCPGSSRKKPQSNKISRRLQAKGGQTAAHQPDRVGLEDDTQRLPERLPLLRLLSRRHRLHPLLPAVAVALTLGGDRSNAFAGRRELSRRLSDEEGGEDGDAQAYGRNDEVAVAPPDRTFFVSCSQPRERWIGEPVVWFSSMRLGGKDKEQRSKASCARTPISPNTT